MPVRCDTLTPSPCFHERPLCAISHHSPGVEHSVLPATRPELEQFAVDASTKRIFDTRPPDQDAQLRFDLRSPSVGTTSNAPYLRKPTLCQCTSVSGRMIAKTFKVAGNQ
jgi:hypothetical protein